MGLNSGELDRLCTLQSRTEADVDDAGQPIVTWVDIATVYCRRKDLSGREMLAAAQIVPSVQVEFIIRWRGDMPPQSATKRRVVCEGVAYDITYIGEIGRRDGLRLLAKLPGDVPS